MVDLEATPGCSLVKDGADPKADYPACCPVYDCEEGTEVNKIEYVKLKMLTKIFVKVKYVKTPAQKKKEAAAKAAAASAAQAAAEEVSE